jgi:hypothetical protein
MSRANVLPWVETMRIFQPRLAATFLLLLDRIRACEHERRALLDVRQQTVEAIGPHRAVRAGKAHVVDHDQPVALAEQLGQGDPTVGIAQRVVRDRAAVGFAPQRLKLLVERLDPTLDLLHARLDVPCHHPAPPLCPAFFNCAVEYIRREARSTLRSA